MQYITVKPTCIILKSGKKFRTTVFKIGRKRGKRRK